MISIVDAIKLLLEDLIENGENNNNLNLSV